MSSLPIFRGKEKLLKAYRFNEVAAWGIFVGKEPMFAYEGDDMEEGEAQLVDVIDNLTEHMGMGTYQLRIYRECPGSITNKTPYNFSFRFQLLDDDEYENRHGPTVQQLKKRIEELEGEEEEEDNSIMGRIGRLIERPEIENFIMQKLMGWANQAFGSKTPMPANMAGFTGMDTTQQQPGGQPPTSAELYNRLPETEKQQFDQAAYILLSGDPQIGTHLMKLANILQTNPGLYQQLTKM